MPTVFVVMRDHRHGMSGQMTSDPINIWFFLMQLLYDIASVVKKA